MHAPTHIPPTVNQSGPTWVTHESFSETPSYLKLTADTRVFSWFFRKTKQLHTSTTIVPDSDFPALPYFLCSLFITSLASIPSNHWSFCHLLPFVGLPQGRAFSDWLFSQGSVCQPSPLPFHNLVVLWFSVLNNIAFSRCTTVCLSIHLWKDILIASRFCQLWIMLP